MINKIFGHLIKIIFLFFIFTSSSFSDERQKFEKKMKSKYKSYTKKIEWVDENTISSTLKQKFTNAELKSTLNQSCKLAKKYKLSGIKIIINSPTGKELVSKNC